MSRGESGAELGDRTRYYGYEDDATAEKGPSARPLPDEEEDPDRVKDRLDGADEDRVEGAHSLQRGGEKNVGKSKLKDPEEDRLEVRFSLLPAEEDPDPT